MWALAIPLSFALVALHALRRPWRWVRGWWLSRRRVRRGFRAAYGALSEYEWHESPEEQIRRHRGHLPPPCPRCTEGGLRVYHVGVRCGRDG